MQRHDYLAHIMSRRITRRRAIAGAASLAAAFALLPACRGDDHDEAIAALRTEAEKRAADVKFSGAAMVAQNGKPLFEGAWGYADIENGIPNKVDTKFGIASLGKLFTATATMQLVQAGKITLDDAFGRYLPTYPNQEMAKATIHQLLTHTAGAGDIWGPDEQETFLTHRSELRDVEDYIALFGERAPRFEPGTKEEYSNYGYVLLGRVIEVVSGERYHDYVREHIFKPASMTSTDNWWADETVPNRAIGYTRTPPGQRLLGAQLAARTDADGPLRPNTDTLPPRGLPAGGAQSTVGDLIRFIEAIKAERLLNAEHAALGKVGSAGNRGGGGPGISAQLNNDPKSGYVIAVLANLDPPAAGGIGNLLAQQLKIAPPSSGSGGPAIKTKS